MLAPAVTLHQYLHVRHCDAEQLDDASLTRLHSIDWQGQWTISCADPKHANGMPKLHTPG